MSGTLSQAAVRRLEQQLRILESDLAEERRKNGKLEERVQLAERSARDAW